MGDDRNGLRGGHGGRVEVARDTQSSSVFSPFSPTALMYSMIDEGEAVSRSVHLIGFNDVRAKPSVLSAGLMRAGPSALHTHKLIVDNRGIARGPAIGFTEKMSTGCLT